MNINIGNIISILAVCFSIWQFKKQILITRALDVEKDRVRLSCSFTNKINRSKYNIKDVIISNDISDKGYSRLSNLVNDKEQSEKGLIRLENVTNNNLYDVYIRVNNDELYQYPVLRANQTIIFELNSEKFDTVVLKGNTFSDEVMFIEFKIKNNDEEQDSMLLFPQYYFMKNSNSMVKYQWGEKLNHSSQKYESLNNKFNEPINTIWMSLGESENK